MKIDDFNKIIVGGHEISKVLHQGKTIWSGVFDVDFSNPELWELGWLNYSTGQPSASSDEARTKNFYKIPSSSLSVTKNSGFGGYLYFYAENYSFISAKDFYNASTIITIPNGATYYKIVFYKGVGAQLEPMNIPVFVPEANIQVEAI